MSPLNRSGRLSADRFKPASINNTRVSVWSDPGNDRCETASMFTEELSNNSPFFLYSNVAFSRVGMEIYKILLILTLLLIPVWSSASRPLELSWLYDLCVVIKAGYLPSVTELVTPAV